MQPMGPLVWPGNRPISAAEATHLLGAPPSEYQRAPDLGGRRRAHGVSWIQAECSSSPRSCASRAAGPIPPGTERRGLVMTIRSLTV
jgi:hypothetical protein